VQRLSKFQVRYKKNAVGDHVIALIFPRLSRRSEVADDTRLTTEQSTAVRGSSPFMTDLGS
jgi:hypothetical protein